MLQILPPRDVFDRPSTTIVHRPFGGYRQVSDRASRISIHAFPASMISHLSGLGAIPNSGAYILANDQTAYFGESIRLARRLTEHASDPAKSAVARDVYVIAGSDGSAFDKNLGLDLQFRLTARAIEASLITVMQGVGPTEVELSIADRATHDILFHDAIRLLHDAGCWFLNGRRSSAAQPDTLPSDDPADAADAGPIWIGVSTTPLGVDEYELTYDGIWARGYWSEQHFIVSAGSEMRTQTNSSCNSLTRARRDDLLQSGVLARIPGTEGRRRLMAAVAFPSISIAGKALCSAHTIPRWVPVTRSRVVVLEGLRQI